MRKVPDTWWGAIVAGVLAGVVGGVAFAIVSGIGDSHSLQYRLQHDVLPFVAGSVVLCMLKHAYNRRRDIRKA
jgi:hypothetical protein